MIEHKSKVVDIKPPKVPDYVKESSKPQNIPLLPAKIEEEDEDEENLKSKELEEEQAGEQAEV